jgi:Uma2 family endonuclease
MTAIPLQRDVEYPESDGQPMAESDLHRDEMIDLIKALQRRYRDEPDVYVTGNLFLYYRQGDPRAVVAPDVFLVRGVPKRKRRIYKLWEEGRSPVLVIEVTSDSTRKDDLVRKKGCYEWLGVEEYFLHDPLGEYLDPRLQGHRLAEGRYRPIPPDPDGSLTSRTTGLILKADGALLRLIDAETGEVLPQVDEQAERLRLAEERAEREAAARRAAEEELARLRRALAQTRKAEGA